MGFAYYPVAVPAFNCQFPEAEQTNAFTADVLVWASSHVSLGLGQTALLYVGVIPDRKNLNVFAISPVPVRTENLNTLLWQISAQSRPVEPDLKKAQTR